MAKGFIARSLACSFSKEKFQLFTFFFFFLYPSVKWPLILLQRAVLSFHKLYFLYLLKRPKVSLPATAFVFGFSFQSLGHYFQLPSFLDRFSRVKAAKGVIASFVFLFFSLPSPNLSLRCIHALENARHTSSSTSLSF